MVPTGTAKAKTAAVGTSHGEGKGAPLEPTRNPQARSLTPEPSQVQACRLGGRPHRRRSVTAVLSDASLHELRATDTEREPANGAADRMRRRGQRKMAGRRSRKGERAMRAERANARHEGRWDRNEGSITRARWQAMACKDRLSCDMRAHASLYSHLWHGGMRETWQSHSWHGEMHGMGMASIAARRALTWRRRGSR